MPLLRVNATASGISMHATSQPVVDCLAAALQHNPSPAVVMVHGYKSAPYHPKRCPHSRIFSRAGCHSWPNALGLTARSGLGIAFGWSAAGRLSLAAIEAQDRGKELACLIGLLRSHKPDHPVHLIAHSLGATMVLAALTHLRAGDVGRIVLLAGAAHKHVAESALGTPAGAAAELINVTSRENDLYDFGFEYLVPGGAALGQGIGAPNALTIQIDCPDTRAALSALGHELGPPTSRICHRSAYIREGVMALNAHLLNGERPLDLQRLKSALPIDPAPRWSRMSPRLGLGGWCYGPLAAAFKTRIMRRRTSKGPDHEHAY